MRSLALLITLWAMLLSTVLAEAQREFVVHDNGFVYVDSVLQTLRTLASMRLGRCAAETSSRTYYAQPQARGWAFGLESFDTTAVLALLRAEPTREELVAYGFAMAPAHEVHVTLWKHQTSGGHTRLELYGTDHVRAAGGIDWTVRATDASDCASRKVYFEVSRDEDSGRFSVRGFVLRQPFSSRPLPEEYAQLIRYTDCLIDTNTRVMVLDDELAPPRGRIFGNSARRAFYVYTNACLARPRAPFDRSRVPVVRNLIEGDAEARRLFLAALAETHRIPPDSFLVELARVLPRYPQARLMNLRRERQGMFSCGHSGWPILQATSIARAAARAGEWEVFVRAHLDVVEYRQELFTHGGPVWTGPRTYVGELEATGIDVEWIIAGAELQYRNAAIGHYRFYETCTGCLIADSPKREVYLQRIAQRVADTRLDDGNRIRAYQTYRMAVSRTEGLSEGAKQRSYLQSASKLPDYLAGAQLIALAKEK